MAVLAVVLHHSGLLRAGFIGVDVFFVVSGFVVVRSLLGTLLRPDVSPASALWSFYKRRVARLAPAFALCVGTMALAAIAFGPIRALPATLGTAVSGLLLTSNLYLYRTDGGYFDFASEDNAFLHLWSLSVEEQFYVFVPPVLALCFWVRSGRAVALAGVAAAALTAASFWASIDFTYVQGVWARLVTAPEVFSFYSPVTRAWEFGVGALLAVYEHRWQRPEPRRFWTVAGFCFLLVGLLVISGTSPFPGWIAALPVLGTAALIVAGRSAVLEARPLVWLGDLSYSWYLWHWPIIVFVRAWVPESVPLLILAGAASLVPAWASYRWVEQPLRIGSGDTPPSASRKFGVSVAVAGLALLMAMGARSWGMSASHPATAWAEQTRLHADVTYGCDASVTPPPGGACIWPVGTAAATEVYLIGDSNAGHFTEALIAASQREGLLLEVRTASGCPPRLDSPSDESTPKNNCAHTVRKIVEQLENAVPAIVTIGRSFEALRSEQPAGRESARMDFERLVERVEDLGHTVVVFAEVPTFTAWPAGGCGAVEVWLKRADACVFQQALSELRSHLGANEAYLSDLQASHPRMIVGDFTDALCPDRRCNSHRDGKPLWRDQTHLSVFGAESLTNAVAAILLEAVAAHGPAGF